MLIMLRRRAHQWSALELLLFFIGHHLLFCGPELNILYIYIYLYTLFVMYIASICFANSHTCAVRISCGGHLSKSCPPLTHRTPPYHMPNGDDKHPHIHSLDGDSPSSNTLPLYQSSLIAPRSDVAEWFIWRPSACAST